MGGCDILECRFFRHERIAPTASRRMALALPGGLASIHSQVRHGFRNNIIVRRLEDARKLFSWRAGRLECSNACEASRCRSTGRTPPRQRLHIANEMLLCGEGI